jgi:hypothetical protein
MRSQGMGLNIRQPESGSDLPPFLRALFFGLPNFFAHTML